MRKIILNTETAGGSFQLSQEARDRCKQTDATFPDDDALVLRDDPALVECVEALGVKAAGGTAELSVVEIPAGIAWQVSRDTDTGYEWVTEIGREWRAKGLLSSPP